MLDGLNPDSDVPVTHVLQLFRTLAYHAHKRKLTDENFADVINRVCDVHLLCQKLESAVILQAKLQKRGEKTPNLDKTIIGLVNGIKAQRTWAVGHVSLVRHCALPGTPIS